VGQYRSCGGLLDGNDKPALLPAALLIGEA
jgi:hypothetical protein